MGRRKEKSSTLIYHDWLGRFTALNNTQFGELIRQVLLYDSSGEYTPSTDGVVRMAFEFIKPTIDSNNTRWADICQKRQDAINKRWGNTSEYNSIQKNTNEYTSIQNVQVNTSDTYTDTVTDTDTDTVTVTDTVTDTDTDISIKEKDKRETRHKYGQYNNVLLSESQYQALQTEFPNDWAERIEKVSEYCASTGKTYKNYLATIRNWAKKDQAQRREDSKAIENRQREELKKENDDFEKMLYGE